jgi:hypothetical protein
LYGTIYYSGRGSNFELEVLFQEMDVDVVMQIHGPTQIMFLTILSEEPDKPFWKWAERGKFTVNSIYKHLCGCGLDRTFKHQWKSKIPLKIKI